MKYARIKSYALNTLYISPHEEYPEGCSGYYVRMPFGLGVKVYNAYNRGRYKTKKEVYGSPEWWIAANALYYMRKAAPSGIVPRAYCIAPVKVKGGYCVGLFMDHVGGEHPARMSRDHWRKISSKLKRVGVAHYDIGEHNIKIDQKGRIQVLDFDSAGPWSKDNE